MQKKITTTAFKSEPTIIVKLDKPGADINKPLAKVRDQHLRRADFLKRLFEADALSFTKDIIFHLNAAAAIGRMIA